MASRPPEPLLSVVALLAAGVVALAPLRDAHAREHAELLFSKGPATDTCPSEEELRRAVVARLGYDPFDGIANAAALRARFTHVASGFSASIERDAKPGVSAPVRVITSASCPELLAPAAIALSLAIDPLAAPPDTRHEEKADPLPALGTPTEEAPAPAPAKREAAPPPAASEAAEADSGDARANVLLDASGHVAFGSAPSAAPGITIAIAVRRRDFSIAAEGRADLPGSTHAGGGEVSAQIISGAIVPCFHRSVVAVCGVLTAGTVLGEGSGVAMATKDTSLYAAFGGRLGLEIPLSRVFYLTLRGDAVIAPSQTVLRLNGIDAWTSSILNTVAAIGAGGTFR